MANNVTNVGFSDYGAEQQDIERKRLMAQKLQEQSLVPQETQMAGGWAIPNSWTGGLAKMLQGYVGAKGQADATERQKALAERARTEFGDWAGKMPQATTQDLNAVHGDDEGNMAPQALQTTQPSRQDMMAWAMRGAGSGNPMAAAMAGPMMTHAMKQDEPYTLGENQKRMVGSQVVAEGNAKQFRPEPPKAPLMNNAFPVGEDKVQPHISFDNGQTWSPLPGSQPAARFAKQVGTTVHNAAPVTSVTLQDPNDPNGTIIVDGRTYKSGGVGSPGVIGKGPKLTEAGKLENKRAFNMQGIGKTIDEAERLLAGTETGTQPTQSGAGAALDWAGRLVGKSPKGAKEAAALEAVGGALTSKMPRMEGPQSDKDTVMYREMAGKVSDRTVPIGERQLALSKVKELWSKYERLNPDAFAPAAAQNGPGQARVVDW